MKNLNNPKFTSLEIQKITECLINHEASISWTEKFEKDFCKHIGSAYSISCNSGTSGLHAALYAAGVSPGDEVILPALTVIMDAYVILNIGATPVFADVIESTHLIDPKDVARKITKKTKAIITVSWEGLMCEMDEIMKLAKSSNLIVIDDSARTFDGYYKNVKAGKAADITVFSFESKKHLTCGGEGGMITTDNPLYATRARKFAGIGYKHLTAGAGETHLAIDKVQDPNYLRFDTIGLNYRMNNISAAVGIAQLERVDEIVGRRKEIGKIFRKNIENKYEWFIPQFTPSYCVHSYYTFSCKYEARYFPSEKNWKAFYYQYKKMGGDGFYAPVMIPYLEPSLNFMMKYENINCPIAENLQQNTMCFKTNYRDLNKAKKQVDILLNLLDTWQ